MPICDEEGCDVLATGKCVNKMELDVCPHYSEEDGDNLLKDSHEEQETVINEVTVSDDTVDVFDGKALSVTDVDRITNNAITRFVILAGMPAAGKTTLLLSLMHIFSTNPGFGNYLFAGSETLLDFEEKSHKSKIDSGNAEEDTGRTPIGLIKFLHLKVANMIENGRLTDLVFTDISGEDFRALKDSTEECRKFTMGQRADHFSLFFDMLKLSCIKDRGGAKVAGFGIIRSLIEAGILLPHSRIQIIFSRWDLNNAEFKAETDEFIDLIKSDMQTQFGAEYEISFYEIAARPKGVEFLFGHGIDQLLPVWVEGSILNNEKVKNRVHATHFDVKRQYLRFEY